MFLGSSFYISEAVAQQQKCHRSYSYPCRGKVCLRKENKLFEEIFLILNRSNIYLSFCLSLYLQSVQSIGSRYHSFCLFSLSAKFTAFYFSDHINLKEIKTFMTRRKIIFLMLFNILFHKSRAGIKTKRLLDLKNNLKFC